MEGRNVSSFTQRPAGQRKEHIMPKYFAAAFRKRVFVVDTTPQTTRQVIFASLKALYERGDDEFFKQIDKFKSAGYEQDIEVALAHL